MTDTSFTPIVPAPPLTGLPPVALLIATPEQLTQDHGIEFQTVPGDIPMQVAAISLDGKTYVMTRALDGLEPGTFILTAEKDAEPVIEALRELPKWTVANAPLGEGGAKAAV